MLHRIIFPLLIVSSLSCNFNRGTVCLQSFVNIACRSTQNAPRFKPFWRLHIDKTIKRINIISSLLCWSVTLIIFIQTLDHSSHCNRENRRPIGDFGNFFNGFAKSPRVLRSSWVLNESNLYWNIVKYCILSEVCMIKTVPHSTVSPQMWCIKSMIGWFTRPQICYQDFVK